MVPIDFSGYFAMALGAPERGGSRRHRMTLRAIRRSVQAGMRPGKGTGRNLALRYKGKQECHDPSADQAGKDLQSSSVSVDSGVHQLPWCLVGLSLSINQRGPNWNPRNQEFDQASKACKGFGAKS